MTPLTFVCFRWTPRPGYRSTFGAKTVSVLRNMIARHYAKPHRFVCVTDTPEDIEPGIETFPLWSDFANVPSPHGGKNPSGYRRLKMFSAEAAEWFGPRFVSMDLDTVITNDITPLFDRADDFVCWGDTNPSPRSHYNGSLMLMTAGTRSQVWTQFDPDASPKLSKDAGCWGSDQGWISYCLGPGEKKWSKADGVYSFRNDIRQDPYRLPPAARIVFFHGNEDPWGIGAQDLEWVKRHWC